MPTPAGSATIGLSMGGGAPPPMLPRPGHLGVPSYPGPSVMRVAQTPSPPRLVTTMTPLDMAKRLAGYYRAGVDSRYKPARPCGVLKKPKELERSKYRPLLQDAAQVMLDFDIRPAAWVAFSLGLWRSHPDGKRCPPPIPWMFAPGRIEERIEDFRAEEGSYLGGRLLYGPAAQDMMRRYALMQRDLIWARPVTEDEVKRVVEKHFPQGLYRRLLDAAAKEAADTEAGLKALVMEGGWAGW